MRGHEICIIAGLILRSFAAPQGTIPPLGVAPKSTTQNTPAESSGAADLGGLSPLAEALSGTGQSGSVQTTNLGALPPLGGPASGTGAGFAQPSGTGGLGGLLPLGSQASGTSAGFAQASGTGLLGGLLPLGGQASGTGKLGGYASATGLGGLGPLSSGVGSSGFAQATGLGGLAPLGGQYSGFGSSGSAQVTGLGGLLPLGGLGSGSGSSGFAQATGLGGLSPLGGLNSGLGSSGSTQATDLGGLLPIGGSGSGFGSSGLAQATGLAGLPPLGGAVGTGATGTSAATSSSSVTPTHTAAAVAFDISQADQGAYKCSTDSSLDDKGNTDFTLDQGNAAIDAFCKQSLILGSHAGNISNQSQSSGHFYMEVGVEWSNAPNPNGSPTPAPKVPFKLNADDGTNCKLMLNSINQVLPASNGWTGGGCECFL